MAEEILFLTELFGLKVYDLKGRKLGRVRDAAIVPLVNAFRVDRYLLGGGWAWLSVRHDQIQTISLEGIWLREIAALAAVTRPQLFRTHPMFVEVETQGSLTCGMTVADRRPHQAIKANTSVALDVEAQGVVDYLTQLLA